MFRERQHDAHMLVIPQHVLSDAARWRNMTYARRAVKRLLDPARAAELQRADDYVRSIGVDPEQPFGVAVEPERGGNPRGLSYWMGRDE